MQNRRPRTLSTPALVALLLLAFTAGAAELRGPKVLVPEPRYDFGTVAAGTRVDHVFEVRNGGDAVLEIRNVQPT